VKIKNVFQLTKLLKENKYSISELSKLCKVSEKTVYRYIQNLKENGYTIQKEYNKYYIVCVKNSDEKTFCEKYSQEFDLKLLNSLRASCCLCHKMKFSYLSPRYSEKLQVKAIGLDVMDIKKRHYLIGFDEDEKIFKEYRIDRMSKVIILPEIDRTIKEKLLQITFLILPETAKYYEGQFDDYQVEALSDGSKKVTMKIHSYFRAKKILFSYLDQIKIIEPKEFADDCIKTLKEMTKNYFLKN
jgi:predicted DNA-binding transcriptional regulator YafY